MRSIKNNDKGYIDVFNYYASNLKQKKQYRNFYEHVYNNYKENLKVERDIKIEMVRLRSLARTNNNIIVISNISFGFVGLVITIITSGLFSIYSGDKTNMVFYIILAYILLIVAFMVPYSITTRNAAIKNDILTSCLEIIEDIEKEIKTETQNPKPYDEVATTQEVKEKSNEQIKHVSHQNNGNWNVEINVGSIVDNIEGIYRIVKFTRKIFSKRK